MTSPTAQWCVKGCYATSLQTLWTAPYTACPVCGGAMETVGEAEHYRRARERAAKRRAKER